ncbi:hypothetical protein DPMN_171132 [Dreissena polymorpha]|uniref:Uncharacterized protein n=1 Tax=Dreissena polymorpha TaxID=45954 RepID=A0A9D4IEW3_DREPO|nr:hypothetical protein DPMN_171132 [Dreissena polymorpha]
MRKVMTVAEENHNHIRIFHHGDRTINVTLRVLTYCYHSHITQNAPSPGGHVFQPTGTYRKINVASRVLKRTNAPPLVPFFEIVEDITGANLLTLFSDNWTINVASRVNNAPPPGSHVFRPTGTIFELVQVIIGTNLLTKFHDAGL